MEFLDGLLEAHRRHHEELGRLRVDWQRLSEVAAALRRLNEVSQLGPGEAEAAIRAVEALEVLFRTCHARPQLEFLPYCSNCGWRMNEPLPAEQLEALREEIDPSFRGRTRRLRALLTEEIVRQQGSDHLEALHQVLTLQQAAALPEVLTPEALGALRACLPAAAPRTDVLQRFREQHPVLREGEVAEAVAEFERMLRAAMAESASEGEEPRIELL